MKELITLLAITPIAIIIYMMLVRILDKPRKGGNYYTKILREFVPKKIRQ